MRVAQMVNVPGASARILPVSEHSTAEGNNQSHKEHFRQGYRLR